MTKAELNEAVAKGCKEDVSKKAVEAIVDCAFEIIRSLASLSKKKSGLLFPALVFLP